MNNLHNAIMNLPCTPNLDYFVDSGTLLTYKYGHRDARHAAAELVLEADKRIEELEVELLNVYKQLADTRSKLASIYAELGGYGEKK